VNNPVNILQRVSPRRICVDFAYRYNVAVSTNIKIGGSTDSNNLVATVV
jgi:hypothetical protein